MLSAFVIAAAGLVLNMVQVVTIVRRWRAKTSLPMDPFLLSLSGGDIYRCLFGTFYFVFTTVSKHSLTIYIECK